MQNAVLVTERGTSQELVHEAANGHRIECATIAVRVHVLLEISFTVLEDEDQLGFCVDDIVEADDVDVLELFHERDLADGSRWCTLFGIQMNFLESDDLICRS